MRCAAIKYKPFTTRVKRPSESISGAYIGAFSKVLPILLLFALGLFLALSRVSFEARYLLIAAIMFAACCGVLLIGRLIQPATRLKSPYFPALLTGFEAGMLGYALYNSVYGANNTTPPITGILLGIAANALGVTAMLNSGSLGQSVLRTLEMLAALTSPLIALLIGYEMRAEHIGHPSWMTSESR
jgi:malate permease and related proteins